MRRLGFITAAILFLLDQLHKWLMLEVVDIDNGPAIEVTPFFNLVMVWNKGVSFGMGRDAEAAPLIFGALAAIIIAFLVFWLWRANSKLLAIALGFVIGGALGNLVDRIRFGAVADFFDFYIGTYHWPAFNIADSAVFLGVAMLIIDSIFSKSETDSHDAKK